MHNNYFFLRQLIKSLEPQIKGAVISECFTQSKNELMVRFETASGSFYIKASLQPEFSCLSFPEEFNRARKNSVDLFEPLIGRHVTAVKQYLNERSFSIILTDGWQLLFKLHGNRSNLVLFHNHQVVDIFRKKLVVDLSTDITSLDRHIDWTFDHFKINLDVLQKRYFTFGKIIWKYLEEKGFHSQSVEEKWQMIQQLLLQLEKEKYYITLLDGTPVFSLLEIGSIQKTFTDPLAAINYFFTTYNTTMAFSREKERALSTLNNQLSSGLSYLSKTREKLNQIQKDDHYKRWADIIMSNLHAIQTGTSLIRLPDFYNDNQLEEIKLKKDLSPQKNAELYYKKSKNHVLEVEHLEKAISVKQKEINEIHQKLEQIKGSETLKMLKEQTKDLNLTEKNKPSVNQPYHEFIHKGFKIWVGKNANANDELTQKYSYKEDLWLHAKDVAGSHVIIKYQAGKKFPKDVIERAAQLAAFNSKRKTETLCPVIVTPRKHVRKRKGDPPGAVVVEKEDVIMVEPRLD